MGSPVAHGPDVVPQNERSVMAFLSEAAIESALSDQLPALLEMRHPHSLVSSDLRIADAFLKERGL